MKSTERISCLRVNKWWSEIILCVTITTWTQRKSKVWNVHCRQTAACISVRSQLISIHTHANSSTLVCSWTHQPHSYTPSPTTPINVTHTLTIHNHSTTTLIHNSLTLYRSSPASVTNHSHHTFYQSLPALDHTLHCSQQYLESDDQKFDDQYNKMAQGSLS